MGISDVVVLLGEIATIIAFMAPMFSVVKKLKAGSMCQLRTEMLRIYYSHKEDKKIRQYEYENFIALYEAYKALKGNSFIDKIHKEIQTWDVES